MRAGYKQTEVGVIPEDWEVKEVRELCTLVNGRGFKPHEWSTRGLPIIRIQNLNGSDEFNYFSGDFNPKIQVEHGQLLFAWSGSRGTSFGPHVWRGETAVLNYHTWKVVAKEDEVDPNFYLSALKNLTKFIEDQAHGASALVHTQKWEMEGFLLAVPEDRGEQRAIAAALADVDAAVAGLERLIAKKRDLKQAAMQQLLTCQTRLPGFSGEWEVKLLGECVSERARYGVNAPAVPYSGHRPGYIRITDISDDGRFVPGPLVSVRESPRNDYLADGDIVLARTGASVGKSYLYDPNDGDLVYAGFLIRVRPRPNELNPRFLAEFLKTREYWNWVQVMSMRSGQPGINGQEYEQLPIKMPALDEQAAIATVLSDMDAELTALQAQLDKTRLIKQAMMQDLLTGRVRLPF